MVRLPESIIWFYGFDLLLSPTIGYKFQNHFQINEVSRMLARGQKMIRTRQRASPDGELKWFYKYKVIFRNASGAEGIFQICQKLLRLKGKKSHRKFCGLP
jgi:hypothetical protein